MKDFKYKYDVTTILQGKGNYGAPAASRFLEIDKWLKDSFDDAYRLYFNNLGQHGYWELLLEQEEYFTAFKLTYGL